MKVTDKKIGEILVNLLSRTQEKNEIKGTSIQRASTPNDTVDVSRIKRIVSDLVKKVKEVPEVREEKIKEIKMAVAKGEYQIDIKTTSAQIIRESIMDEIL